MTKKQINNPNRLSKEILTNETIKDLEKSMGKYVLDVRIKKKEN